MASSTGYAATFPATPLLLIPGTLHGLGTADLLYQLYDASDAAIEPSSVRVDATSYTVTITFAVPQSGRVLLLPVGMASSPSLPPSVPPAAPVGGIGGMDPALVAMLTETVRHRAYLGQDGYGTPVFGPTTLRACRLEFKVQPVRTAQGEEYASETHLYFAVDFTLKLRDQLVLADGTAPQIQAVHQYTDEYGARHHQVAFL